MKKIFLTIFLIMLTTLNANAAAIVKYGVGGVPISMNIGPNRYSVVGNYYRFGENALAFPQNIARQRMIKLNRELSRRNSIATRYVPAGRNYGGVLPPPPPAYTQSISRLNRNYRVNMPRRTYVRNGITYYN